MQRCSMGTGFGAGGGGSGGGATTGGGAGPGGGAETFAPIIDGFALEDSLITELPVLKRIVST